MIWDRLHRIGRTRHRLLLLGKRRFRMIDHLDLHGGSNWLVGKHLQCPPTRTALDRGSFLRAGQADRDVRAKSASTRAVVTDSAPTSVRTLHPRFLPCCYCGLMPAAFTTVAHFCVSVRM
jgi:hypothetical protein